jgi:magnesium chelatase family protein
VQESRERIRSAIKNSKYTFPTKRITINLAPAHIRKVGSQYDLGIALGILLCDIPQYHAKASEYVCIGELALNGEVRSVRGALALILAAIGSGYQKIIVSVPDYLAVTELDVTLSEFLIAVESLAKAYEIITGKPPSENSKKGSTCES